MTGHDHPHNHDHDHAGCLALFERLSEYIDGELDPGLRGEIETHMEACIRCKVCLEMLKRTVLLCNKLEDRPAPESLSRKLRNFAAIEKKS